MRFLKAMGKANSLKKHFIHVCLSAFYKITVQNRRELAVVGQTTVVYYAGQRQLENDKNYFIKAIKRSFV